MVANLFWNALWRHSYNVAFHYREMGGRRLGSHRKSKERVKGEERRKSENRSLTVPLPISVYFKRPAEVILLCIVVSLPLSACILSCMLWPSHLKFSQRGCLNFECHLHGCMVTQADPLLICKLALMTPEQPYNCQYFSSLLFLVCQCW